MKVAILTLRFHSNFGFIMQAFAMQKIVRQLGHDPYTYDTRIEVPSTYIKIKQAIKNLILKIAGIYDGPIFWRYPSVEVRNKLDANTNKFISENIQLTEYCRNINEIRSYNNEEFEAFIVGSDQVWREEFSLNIPTYFFDFVRHDAKKIAYAASFGTSVLDFTIETKKKCKGLIKQFSLVGVRESEGVRICKEEFNIDAVQVLDPTMLISKNVYSELADAGDVMNDGKPYIFVYVLSMTHEIECFISKLSMEKRMPAINIRPLDYTRNKRATLEECVYPSIYTFLRSFRDAKYVVTDSFHGSVFSILFNTQFFVFSNKYRGSSRISTLLNTFKLGERLVISDTILDDVSYIEANEILQKKKKESINLLKNSLNE